MKSSLAQCLILQINILTLISQINKNHILVMESFKMVFKWPVNFICNEYYGSLCIAERLQNGLDTFF